MEVFFCYFRKRNSSVNVSGATLSNAAFRRFSTNSHNSLGKPEFWRIRGGVVKSVLRSRSATNTGAVLGARADLASEVVLAVGATTDPLAHSRLVDANNPAERFELVTSEYDTPTNWASRVAKALSQNTQISVKSRVFACGNPSLATNAVVPTKVTATSTEASAVRSPSNKGGQLSSLLGGSRKNCIIPSKLCYMKHPQSISGVAAVPYSASRLARVRIADTWKSSSTTFYFQLGPTESEKIGSVNNNVVWAHLFNSFGDSVGWAVKTLATPPLVKFNSGGLSLCTVRTIQNNSFEFTSQCTTVSAPMSSGNLGPILAGYRSAVGAVSDLFRAKHFNLLKLHKFGLDSNRRTSRKVGCKFPVRDERPFASIFARNTATQSAFPSRFNLGASCGLVDLNGFFSSLVDSSNSGLSELRFATGMYLMRKRMRSIRRVFNRKRGRGIQSRQWVGGYSAFRVARPNFYTRKLVKRLRNRRPGFLKYQPDYTYRRNRLTRLHYARTHKLFKRRFRLFERREERRAGHADEWYREQARAKNMFGQHTGFFASGALSLRLQRASHFRVKRSETSVERRVIARQLWTFRSRRRAAFSRHFPGAAGRKVYFRIAKAVRRLRRLVQPKYYLRAQGFTSRFKRFRYFGAFARFKAREIAAGRWLSNRGSGSKFHKNTLPKFKKTNVSVGFKFWGKNFASRASIFAQRISTLKSHAVSKGKVLVFSRNRKILAVLSSAFARSQLTGSVLTTPNIRVRQRVFSFGVRNTQNVVARSNKVRNSVSKSVALQLVNFNTSYVGGSVAKARGGRADSVFTNSVSSQRPNNTVVKGHLSAEAEGRISAMRLNNNQQELCLLPPIRKVSGGVQRAARRFQHCFKKFTQSRSKKGPHALRCIRAYQKLRKLLRVVTRDDSFLRGLVKTSAIFARTLAAGSAVNFSVGSSRVRRIFPVYHSMSHSQSIVARRVARVVRRGFEEKPYRTPRWREPYRFGVKPKKKIRRRVPFSKKGSQADSRATTAVSNSSPSQVLRTEEKLPKSLRQQVLMRNWHLLCYRASQRLLPAKYKLPIAKVPAIGSPRNARRYRPTFSARAKSSALFKEVLSDGEAEGAVASNFETFFNHQTTRCGAFIRRRRIGQKFRRGAIVVVRQSRVRRVLFGSSFSKKTARRLVRRGHSVQVVVNRLISQLVSKGLPAEYRKVLWSATISRIYRAYIGHALGETKSSNGFKASNNRGSTNTRFVGRRRSYVTSPLGSFASATLGFPKLKARSVSCSATSRRPAAANKGKVRRSIYRRFRNKKLTHSKISKRGIDKSAVYRAALTGKGSKQNRKTKPKVNKKTATRRFTLGKYARTKHRAFALTLRACRRTTVDISKLIPAFKISGVVKNMGSPFGGRASTVAVVDPSVLKSKSWSRAWAFKMRSKSRRHAFKRRERFFRPVQASRRVSRVVAVGCSKAPVQNYSPEWAVNKVLLEMLHGARLRAVSAYSSTMRFKRSRQQQLSAVAHEKAYIRATINQQRIGYSANPSKVNYLIPAVVDAAISSRHSKYVGLSAAREQRLVASGFIRRLPSQGRFFRNQRWDYAVAHKLSPYRAISKSSPYTQALLFARTGAARAGFIQNLVYKHFCRKTPNSMFNMQSANSHIKAAVGRFYPKAFATSRKKGFNLTPKTIISASLQRASGVCFSGVVGNTSGVSDFSKFGGASSRLFAAVSHPSFTQSRAQIFKGFSPRSFDVSRPRVSAISGLLASSRVLADAINTIVSQRNTNAAFSAPQLDDSSRCVSVVSVEQLLVKYMQPVLSTTRTAGWVDESEGTTSSWFTVGTPGHTLTSPTGSVVSGVCLLPLLFAEGDNSTDW